MDLQEVRYRWRRLFDGFDRDKLRRAKVIGAGVFVVIALLWVGIRVAPIFKSPRKAEELTGPGWTLVGELNEALLQKPGFADVTFVVASEDPLKLRVVGAVRSEQDLAALKDYVGSLKTDVPPEEIEFEVEILK